MLAADITEYRRPVIKADADRQSRLASRLAFLVPAVECHQHLIRAFERIGGVLDSGLRHAEYREDFVSNIFIDCAAAGEDRGRHPLVILAQHSYHRLWSHLLGHAREADNIREQY